LIKRESKLKNENERKDIRERISEDMKEKRERETR